MKTITILLIIALIIPFMGCAALNQEDNRITELEKRVTELETQADQWRAANTRLQDEKAAAIAKHDALAKQYNDLVTMNRALMAEKQDLKERLVSMTATAEDFSYTIKKLVPERVHVIYQVDFKHNELYNKDITGKIAKDTLARVKELTAKGHKVRIKVEGYSSKAGTKKLNKWFSKERAEGVAHKMFSLGVDASMVEIIAHGETDDNERKVIVTVEVLL